MNGFKSKIEKESESFKKNREDMLGLVDRMRSLEKRARDQSEKRKPS